MFLDEEFLPKEEKLVLRKPVKPFYPNNLDDVNALRGTMEKVNGYKGVSPTFYERSYMDKPLEENIKSYQKKKELEIDGIVNPGGETETSVNGELKKKKECSAKGLVQKYKEEGKDVKGDNLITIGLPDIIENQMLKKIPKIGPLLSYTNTGYGMYKKGRRALSAYEKECKEE